MAWSTPITPTFHSVAGWGTCWKFLRNLAQPVCCDGRQPHWRLLIQPILCDASGTALIQKRIRIAKSDLESDPNGPLSIEQPTQLVPKPLESEFQDDRIRAVFGLTTDDPLPPRNWDTDEKYYHYLKSTLQFPFAARYIDESVPYDKGRDRTGTVIQMFEDFHTDEGHGAMCQIREGDRLREMPLAELDVPEDDPNRQIIDDYTCWFYNADDEVWDDDLPDDFAEDFEPTDDEDYDDVVDFGGAVFPEKDDFDDEEPPPKLASRNRTGCNDPCPCGSGKKFKKCCLKK